MHDAEASLRSINERAVRSFLDGMEAGNKAMVRAGLHDRAVLKLPRPSFTGRVISGGDVLAEFLVALGDQVYRERRATYGNLLIDDHHGVAEWRLQAVLLDGRNYDQYYCWLFDFEDGLIAEVREYIDTSYGERMNGRIGGKVVDDFASARG